MKPFVRMPTGEYQIPNCSFGVVESDRVSSLRKTITSRQKARNHRRSKPKKSVQTDTPAEREYDLGADTALLQEIKTALRDGSAGRALTLLKQHEGQFPRPAQPDVRVALWVETLCALDRADQAATRAKALLERRPGTPVARRLRASCARKALEQP